MDTQRGNARKTPWQIFATPTLIALLSLVGLLAAQPAHDMDICA